jgi:predicted NAD/FAD-binding protein
MRIAIVGTGIAGNAAAFALTTGSQHQVAIYEKEDRVGGHSATVDVDYDGVSIAVDTGFIVYNEMNYPNLTALFAHLGVETLPSDMSFALSARGGRFEWCGRTYDVLNGLFAQRSNCLSPRYLAMLLDVTRFNKLAASDHAEGRLAGLTLRDYLKQRRFSDRFRDGYLVPMGAAIWSMSPAAMLGFPAESFVAFFRNHHLMQWNRPQWRTVHGGSRAYVEKLTASFRDKIKTGRAARMVERDDDGVRVTDSSGQTERFDQIIFASHSDETLAMLASPSPVEAEVLGAVGYRGNDVYLHRDIRLMPKRQRAWAAWNVIQSDDDRAEVCVTYWMNVLQSIDRSRPLFVTLNPPEPPAPGLTFARFNYAHPQYDEAAIKAQKRLDDIQGRNRSWFCGAWTGYGFHEDGLASGLRVAEMLGAAVPWRAQPAIVAEAAE